MKNYPKHFSAYQSHWSKRIKCTRRNAAPLRPPIPINRTRSDRFLQNDLIPKTTVRSLFEFLPRHTQSTDSTSTFIKKSKWTEQKVHYVMPRTTMGVYVVTWRIWLIHCLLIGPCCNSAGSKCVRGAFAGSVGGERRVHLKATMQPVRCIRLALDGPAAG
jgi:hypothetical protein